MAGTFLQPPCTYTPTAHRSRGEKSAREMWNSLHVKCHRAVHGVMWKHGCNSTIKQALNLDAGGIDENTSLFFFNLLARIPLTCSRRHGLNRSDEDVSSAPLPHWQEGDIFFTEKQFLLSFCTNFWSSLFFPWVH